MLLYVIRSKYCFNNRTFEYTQALTLPINPVSSCANYEKFYFDTPTNDFKMIKIHIMKCSSEQILVYSEINIKLIPMINVLLKKLSSSKYNVVLVYIEVKNAIQFPIKKKKKCHQSSTSQHDLSYYISFQQKHNNI